MLIENRSRYLLKKVRAKAKMNEYHIPPELHGKTESDANYLLVLAIATLGDFSNDIIKSYKKKEIDYTEHRKNLQFASVFFDAYLDAKMYEGDIEYYLLLGSVVYYLCDYNGSSKVLADRISSDINIEVNGVDVVLSQILQGKLHIECSDKKTLLNEVVNAYNEFWSTGTVFDYNKLSKLKQYIYRYGTDRELLFSDALVATVFLKIEHSSYRLMPLYTQVEPAVWGDILRKRTLISELWQSQRQLGEAGVFSGKSATIQMPTSSGKTKSVALIILSAFLRNSSNYALVVAPFRSLCREITDELQQAFSYTNKIHVNEISDVMQMDFLDALLGNVHETEEKYVYVVTPEKLLFVLRQEVMFLSNVGLIIFDEGHLFDDISRGITYELLISTIKSYMKDKMQKILISAVIPNAEQVNGWLTNESGVVIKNNIIQTTEKVVAMTDMRNNTTSGQSDAYLFFVNPTEPEEEEFFVPRVIQPTNLELRPRERKERLFPAINDGTNRNDMAIAFGIKLCPNGAVAVFCGKKETAEKIL
ncbi:MAG: DEAD/DEAH box helicase, partial [Lachnospiraceae bacterium]|nr:DEAD/DEAH box helicase [Lachnospiraceae bacterium]